LSDYDYLWQDFLSEQTEPAQRMYRRQRKRNGTMYTKDGGLPREKYGKPYNSSVRPFGTDPLRFEEAIEPDSVDLSDFVVHDTLDDRVWESDEKIDPQIRERLLKIAKEFYDELGIKAEIKDITLTGSLANYNWSKHSDLDVHLVVDYRDVADNIDLVKQLFRQAKSNWNSKHDIKLKNYDVELYVQDSEEPHFSTGVYSLMNDKFLTSPSRRVEDFDREAVKKKAASMMDMVEEVQLAYDEGEYDKAFKMANRAMRKLRKARTAGLEREGEYSYENLAFKVLRRNEYLDRLSKLKVDSYDALMSQI